MTGANAGEQIDPSVWRDVVSVADDKAVVRLSFDFFSAAEAAADLSQKNVLRTLGITTSAMLKPDSWNEPFTPMMTLADGRRSALPEDLDDAQRELLLRVAAVMDEADEPSLRARVYDVCWTYINRGAAAMLTAAVGAYIEIPLEPDVWFRDGHDEWRRAFELVRRHGRSGRSQADAMSSMVRDRLQRSQLDEGFFGVQLSDFARNHGVVDKTDRGWFAALCVRLAEQARQAGSWRLARAWDEEAAGWYSGAGDNEAVSRALSRVGRDFEDDAVDRRRGVGGDAATASHFMEQAIAVLRKLPKTFRVANGVDEHIRELRRQLVDDRETLLASMKQISVGSVDLEELAAEARRLVSGHDDVTALFVLASLCPLADPAAAEAEARVEMREHPLSSLFGGETYRGSGQKVARRPGMSLDGGSGESNGVDGAVWATMLRNVLLSVEAHVVGAILPAMELVTAEHRYPIGLLFGVCRSSLAVPVGHEGLWALGLQRGLDGDFASAASILVPQIEHWVRTALKAHGSHTLVTDDHGVETEKGLGTLLDDPFADQAIGAPWVFELKTLLTEQGGPNLRNDIAHGLVDDRALNSAAAIYAWLLALKIVMQAFVAGRTAQDGKEDDVGNGHVAAAEGNQEAEAPPGGGEAKSRRA